MNNILMSVLLALKNRAQQSQVRPQSQNAAGSSLPLSQIISAAKGGLPGLGAGAFSFAAPPVVNAVTNMVGRWMGQPTGGQPAINPLNAPKYAIGTVANAFGPTGLFSSGGGTENINPQLKALNDRQDAIIAQQKSGQITMPQMQQQLLQTGFYNPYLSSYLSNIPKGQYSATSPTINPNGSATMTFKDTSSPYGKSGTMGISQDGINTLKKIYGDNWQAQLLKQATGG